jgi:Calx-beta domain-containing protein/flagellar hook capping protein FlgD
MFPRPVGPLFIALFLGLVAPDAAHSANSQWHAGSNLYPDASCQWGLFDSATPEAPALSGGVLTLATSEGAENLYYLQNTNMSIPSTLTISARLRVVSETHIEGPRRGVGIGFVVAPDLGNVLFFGRDEVFLFDGAFGQQGPVASVDTDNALHIYEIRVVNQSAITVYQDGVQILTGSTLTSPSWADAPTFYWGDITGDSFATSEWVFFRHNANTTECGAPSLSINDVAVSEGNSGTVNATFTVSLSHPSNQTVTLNYATANGTAVGGSDYVAGSGPLTIPAEALSTTVTVVVNGDVVNESNETFLVNLSGAANATIADGQGQGTVTDDDSGPGTLDLAWNDVPAHGQQNRVFACNTNSSFHSLYGSFTPATNFNLLQLTAEIEIRSDGPLPDWWQFGSGQCRQGAASISVEFTGSVNAADPYGGTAVGGILSYTLVAPNRACMVVVGSMSSGPRPVVAGVEYYAFRVAVNSSKTVNVGSCPGCATPVCITLRGIELSNDFSEKVEIFDPNVRNFATWQGGASACPTPPPSAVSISDASVTEGSGGTSTMTFTLTRNSAGTGCETIRRTVAYEVVPVSATPGDDYVPASGTAAFVAGGLSASVNVTVNGDATAEPDETFLVRISNPRGLSLADAEGVGTILNDDGTADVPPGAGVMGPLVLPNPFRGGIEISFALARGGLVRLEVYDPSGRRVRASPRTYLPAGSQTLAWDGRGDDGSALPSGVYSLRVSGPGIEFARRVVRLK